MAGGLVVETGGFVDPLGGRAEVAGCLVVIAGGFVQLRGGAAVAGGLVVNAGVSVDPLDVIDVVELDGVGVPYCCSCSISTSLSRLMLWGTSSSTNWRLTIGISATFSRSMYSGLRRMTVWCSTISLPGTSRTTVLVGAKTVLAGAKMVLCCREPEEPERPTRYW